MVAHTSDMRERPMPSLSSSLSCCPGQGLVGSSPHRVLQGLQLPTLDFILTIFLYIIHILSCGFPGTIHALLLGPRSWKFVLVSTAQFLYIWVAVGERNPWTPPSSWLVTQRCSQCLPRMSSASKFFGFVTHFGIDNKCAFTVFSSWLANSSDNRPLKGRSD